MNRHRLTAALARRNRAAGLAFALAALAAGPVLAIVRFALECLNP